MANRILRSHIREGGYSRSLLFSILGHLLLLIVCLIGVEIFPVRVVQLGSGQAGGSGGADIVNVGLVAEPTGGDQTLYKPALEPKPLVAPLPAPPEETTQQNRVAPDDFVVSRTNQREEKEASEPETAPSRQTPTSRAPQKETVPGTIPQQAEPGKEGPAEGAAGSGAQGAGGTGLLVGPGSGQGGIDSWYVRQVELRVGRNWLRSSMGAVSGQVEAIVSFDVQPSGQISNIQFEKRTGLNNIDLAVQRAIQVSSPLPPPPRDARLGALRFRAVFQYPPQ